MNTSVILLVLLAITVGFVAGAMVALIWKDHEGKQIKDQPGKDSRSALYQEIARLWRDRSSQKTLLEMQGQMYADPQKMSESQHQAAVDVLKTWQVWLGAEKQEPVLPPPPAAVPTRPLTEFLPAAQARGTIVEQIDTVLQEMLSGTMLEARKIRLAEEPRQGVIVWVGPQRYEGIEAVPEPAIQAVIRAAVAKWEHFHAE